MTEQEKRQLRFLIAEQAKTRNRKNAERRKLDPKHGDAELKKRPTFTAEEISLVKKLCQPKAFVATLEECAIMEEFTKTGIVKSHNDGTVELTMKGANIYVRTLERENQNECHDETQG